jgi:hypothetical protein
VEAVIAYFGLLVIGVFVVAGLVVASASDRRRVALAAAWGAYAARHHYAFVDGRTPERAFRIQGSREGIDFTLETDTRGTLVTRLVARRLESSEGRVVAALGGGRRGESDGAKAATGDRHFNHVFDVRASAPLVVDTVLPSAVRLALQRFPTPMVGKALRLAIDGDEVTVEWAGGAVDPALIDAAHTILREVLSVARGATGRQAAI